MKDVADDLALIVRNAIAYIKELERKIHELKREAEPVQEPVAWAWETSHELAPQDAFSWVQTAIHKMPLYTAPPQRKPVVDPAEYDDAGAAERYNRGLK